MYDWLKRTWPYLLGCIYYIHPELDIGNCRFRSGKKSKAVLTRAPKEHGGEAREQEGIKRSNDGAVQRRSRWKPLYSQPRL